MGERLHADRVAWNPGKSRQTLPATGSRGSRMSVLKNLENKIAGLVEGTFSRAFRSEVRPVEIARKLAREMEEHKSFSVSRTYAPNEYRVFLSPRDRERFAGYEAALTAELAGYLLEHARRERLALLSRPVDRVRNRRAAGPGRIRHPDPGAPSPTTNPSAPRPRPNLGARWSTATPSGWPNRSRSAAALAQRRCSFWSTASGSWSGRSGATLGRGRQCDVVLERPERFAPARRDPAPRWVMGDRRPRLDERLAAQRPPDRRLRGAQAGRRDRARRRRR